MEHSIFYCFRNRLKEIEGEIRKSAEEQQVALSIRPTSCMKLCMFCEGQHVAIVDKQVIIEQSEEQIIKRILEKCH